MKAKEVPELCPEDVVRLGDEVRNKWHEDLEEAEIAYVFIPHAPTAGGRTRLGSAHKESAVHKLVSHADFIIVLSKDLWLLLDEAQRTALLDHEMCHCVPKLDDDGLRVGWELRKHDVEEFNEVIGRHGLWRQDVKTFIECGLVQLKLIMPEAKKPKKGKGEAA